jgi:hypothetical protein
MGEYRRRVSSMPSQSRSQWRQQRQNSTARNFRVNAPHGKVYCGFVRASASSSEAESTSDSSQQIASQVMEHRYTVRMDGDGYVGKNSIVRSFRRRNSGMSLLLQ